MSYKDGWVEINKRIYEWSEADLRVVVHRHRDYPPAVWLVSCAALGIRNHELDSVNLAEAQLEGLR
jgi:hypothetical protein